MLELHVHCIWTHFALICWRGRVWRIQHKCARLIQTHSISSVVHHMPDTFLPLSHSFSRIYIILKISILLLFCFSTAPLSHSVSGFTDNDLLICFALILASVGKMGKMCSFCCLSGHLSGAITAAVSVSVTFISVHLRRHLASFASGFFNCFFLHSSLRSSFFRHLSFLHNALKCAHSHISCTFSALRPAELSTN